MSRKRKHDEVALADDTSPSEVQLYELLGMVGDGGQCEVYAAQHSRTGTRVALKVGHPVDSTDDPVYQVTLMEWQCYQKLGAVENKVPFIQQYGIAEVYGRGLLTCTNRQVRPWIAMQLLGRSLESLIASPVTKVRELYFRYADQMLTALQYCHHRGILHRDVKPGNFCLDTCGLSGPEALTSGQAVLVDFGFAHPFRKGSFELKADFGGTPDFASTRSLLSEPTGPSDDLESLGYALLQMWLGEELPWDVTVEAGGTRRLPSGGWTRGELAGFAAKRACVWKAMCAKQMVPPFLQRWVQRAKAIMPGRVPSYDTDFRELLYEAKDAFCTEE